jgi:hypothetical protein
MAQPEWERASSGSPIRPSMRGLSRTDSLSPHPDQDMDPPMPAPQVGWGGGKVVWMGGRGVKAALSCKGGWGVVAAIGSGGPRPLIRYGDYPDPLGRATAGSWCRFAGAVVVVGAGGRGPAPLPQAARPPTEEGRGPATHEV